MPSHHSDTRRFPAAADPAQPRFLGIDVGAETIKLAELVREGNDLRWTRRRLVEHGKEPTIVLPQLLKDWDWDTLQGAAASGRFSKQVSLPRVPTKQAQARAFRYLADSEPATLVSIGSHGFSVLELRPSQVEVFRENSRCSQGTGNFLRQLVERFSLTIEQASAMADAVDKAAALSGRCPVILKSDMTHLANKGEDRGRILAGLFDAVCENVLVLLKPELSPRRVVLIGGVSRSSRVRNGFRQFLARHGMTLLALGEEDGLFFEALGSALVAADSAALRPEGEPNCPPPGSLKGGARSSLPRQVPLLDELIVPARENKLERVPSLAAALPRVHRMPSRPLASVAGVTPRLILGFDIGSTGSKAVALDPTSDRVVWEGYRRTLGDPVGAAQELLREFVAGAAGHCPVVSLGVTGSGREIVGSLLTSCYGKEGAFILNEIAAHAEGALHYDPRVDTIFEIGGQDAKYIRLAEGRVVDCAMNEACSAGTGSFIEEQGRKFSGIRDVVHLGEEALAAAEGVSLGQHCSVFMAEIIDEAVAGGVDQRSIIAGLYDSIIQNYLHRVKGNRSVGRVIFCQGMPFASDALAAAVAHQTGGAVIVPPNPGTVGALGIALLTRKELAWRDLEALELPRFLGARVESKDNFLCKATTGCGGGGNLCRIERLRTVVADKRQSFTWGGGCALHDKATRKKKLPDRAPDPFREREDLIKKMADRLMAPVPSQSSSTGFPEPAAGERRTAQPGPARAATSQAQAQRKTVAISDEFMLKGLFPFFATFLREIGFELLVIGGGDQTALKRGIAEANVPYCAPMQQFHGLASRMAETGADYLFLPMVRSLPRVDGEPYAVTCPIVQAGPDILRLDLSRRIPGRVLSPVVDVDEGGLESPAFLACCRELAKEAGCSEQTWQLAHRLALQTQKEFDHQCLEIGRRTLEFCQRHGISPVVVLGRPYTIYNTVLNSNVPAILREQGAIGIPVDCYPVADDVPVFAGMYWSYALRILRAAHQIRRTPQVYSLYCSNYSCGPDSFNLHFFAYIMEGKPFAIIETDGHSGDAGTKTRVEAFLHCVAQDIAAGGPCAALNDFRDVEIKRRHIRDVTSTRETLIIPWIGDGSQAVAACFRGLGIPTECLPMPDAEALRLGRRHTSGKECLPMCLTLGNLLKRMERSTDPTERLTVLMPNAQGPCREGAYNLLSNITLDRLGQGGRVRIWTLDDSGYFAHLPPGLSGLLFTGVMGTDLLLEALHTVRPVENRKGAASILYRHHLTRLLQHLERQAAGDLSVPQTLWQIASGQFFGVRRLLAEAAADFGALRMEKEIPTVLVVGEIYVRCDPFANNFIIEKLEERGLRARLAPFTEWIEYCDLIAKQDGGRLSLGERLTSAAQSRIQNNTYRLMAGPLGWPQRPAVAGALEAAESYLRSALRGEAALTIGTPLQEWREHRIDGLVSVGPLECMPNKIAEAQFFHVAEQECLLSLTLPLNGDPIDAEVLNNFAFEVRSRFRKRGPHPVPNDAGAPRRTGPGPECLGGACDRCRAGERIEA
jgi:predicted CoA-substrate-specific enzyme activase